MEYLIFALIGLLIGTFSGLFGIGGGVILAPLLLILGTPPTVAIGTSLMLSLATSLIGSAAHLRLRNIRWRVAGIIAVAGMISVQFTQPFVLYLESRELVDFVIPLVFIVLLLSFALFLSLKRPEKEPHTEKKLIMPEYIYFIGIGFIAGVFSIMLGVSGGFIIVPLLIGLLRFPVKAAVGTSLASVVLIVLLGFVKYTLTTPIEYTIGFLLIAGTLFGSPLGARLTNFFSNNEMKRLLSFLYLSLALSMTIRLFFPPELAIITLLLYFLAFLTYLFYKQKAPLTQ